VLTAKRAAKRLVAISTQNFLTGIAGDPFGFLVEKKDAPVHVMGNDTFFEIVQNRFQIVLVAH
jgi:hypothetical protein